MSEPERAATVSGRGGYVGRPWPKYDGRRFVTGRVTYTADVVLPRTAHVAIVRSTQPHATITGVDCTEALAMPGVVDVLTGREAAALADPIAHNLDPAGLGGNHGDVRCLAIGKVVYVGQPVVAVVAETVGDAKAAAERIEVSYAPLEPVLSVEDATREGAPLLYENWGSNVMISGTVGEGDFAAVARSAAHLLEGEVSLQRSTSAPMETRAYLAHWDDRDQRLTWYGTTQNPHPQRWVLAQSLRLAESQIRVIAPTPGGAFGLKMHGHPEEVLVAVLARKLARPVKWVESRAECMIASGKEQTHRWSAAYDDDGHVLGVEITLVADHGAVAAGPGWGMAFVGSLVFPSGYAIAVSRVHYSVVVTNKGPWAGARPFGKEAPALVMERIMDLVAEATRVDPLEIRRRNWVKPSQFPFRTASGQRLDSGDYHGLLNKALARLDYAALRAEQARLHTENRYLGIGVGFELMPEGADIPGALVGGYDTTTVRMNPSGEVTVLTGVTSPGGGNDTGIAQIVADRLGVRIEAISVVQGDTDMTPFGYGNLSSRGLLAGGGAAALAADDIADKLRVIAASMLHVEPSDISLGGGMAAATDDSAKALPLVAVAHAAYSLGYILALGIEPTLESTRTYKPTTIRHLPDEAGHIQPFASFSNALHISVVEVDADTGVVELRRHVAVHDCGTMVNPGLVAGQFAGGIVMGLGAAISEELVHDNSGALMSDGFKTYLLPRATDIPQLEIGHQETPSPFTPMGVKGAGESGFAGAVASVTNAVNDALRPLGFRLDSTPLSPSRVLAGIDASRAPAVR
jgi:aerobic carbon-monoxide dehydrogenase large subunit